MLEKNRSNNFKITNSALFISYSENIFFLSFLIFFPQGHLIIKTFDWQWIANIWSPQAADGGPKATAWTVRSKSFLDVEPFVNCYLIRMYFGPTDPTILSRDLVIYKDNKYISSVFHNKCVFIVNICDKTFSV